MVCLFVGLHFFNVQALVPKLAWAGSINSSRVKTIVGDSDDKGESTLNTSKSQQNDTTARKWTFSVFTASASTINGYTWSSDIKLRSSSYSSSLSGSSLSAYNSNGGYLNGPEWWFDPSNIPFGFEAFNPNTGFCVGIMSLHLKMETRPNMDGSKYRLAWGRSEEALLVGYKSEMGGNNFSYSIKAGPSILFTKPQINAAGLNKATNDPVTISGSSGKVSYGGYGFVVHSNLQAGFRGVSLGLNAGFSLAHVATRATLVDNGETIGRFVHTTFSPYVGFNIQFNSWWRIPKKQ